MICVQQVAFRYQHTTTGNSGMLEYFMCQHRMTSGELSGLVDVPCGETDRERKQPLQQGLQQKNCTCACVIGSCMP